MSWCEVTGEGGNEQVGGLIEDGGKLQGRRQVFWVYYQRVCLLSSSVERSRQSRRVNSGTCRYRKGGQPS